MWALAASADGVLDPEAVRRTRRPVILVQAGIHAGEIEGKDAGFEVLRGLLAGELAPSALAAATLVFVPVFNVDGHERFGPNHRPNQRGPEETGFRATAANLNLNRDHMKADSVEMRALLGVWTAWDPVLMIDLHDVAVMVEPFVERADGLHEPARALSAALQSRLRLVGHLPLHFYPSFKVEDEPTSGFEHAEAWPRFSQSYAAARNRLGILVETHSWASYERRVDATRDLLQIVLERAASDARAWRAAADRADALALTGQDVVLAYRAGGEPETIEFLGYAYAKRASEVSGGTWIVYDEEEPAVWHVPLWQTPVPQVRVRAPGAGYLVPAGWAPAVEAVLTAHGVEFRRVAAGQAEGEAYRAREVTYKGPYEGRQTAKVTGAWAPTRLSWPAGSLFVPVAQPRARLALHLLEPEAPDSFVAWGSLNAAFEQKEYMEAYVTEAEARRMLAADPALEQEFEARLRADKVFAASPDARLRFFYERHPAFDERVMLVPIFKLDAPPG
jgi:hypothetical protein